MAIIETKFYGKWIKMKYESPKSHNIYEIDCHWDGVGWKPTTCTCKGFTNRATCRHLEEALKELDGIPEPKHVEGDLQMKRGFWMRCAICDGCEFMIRPVNEKVIIPNDTNPLLITETRYEYICSDCGRLYK